jgi:DNA-binding response OmpR family regulator
MIKQSLSILIIEDNPALAANIYDYLEACGHTPDAAPDGESGLGLLAIKLRKAVDGDAEHKLMRTVAGSGYRLCASDE